MIVCEYEFQRPNPKSPAYSLVEYDIYMWIPAEFRDRIPNHRLSLRKNLRSGRFELYRFYYHDGSEEVIFEGSLERCLEAARREWIRFHGSWSGVEPEFRLCDHRRETSNLCPRRGMAR